MKVLLMSLMLLGATSTDTRKDTEVNNFVPGMMVGLLFGGAVVGCAVGAIMESSKQNAVGELQTEIDLLEAELRGVRSGRSSTQWCDSCREEPAAFMVGDGPDAELLCQACMS